MKYYTAYTRNAEGYADPTAAAALLHIERERQERHAVTQKEFYKSRAWRRARDAYIAQRIAIDGGMCEVCGQTLGKVVHHKIWLNDYNCTDPRIALNAENFRYECQTCHNAEENPETGSRWKDGQGPQRQGRRVIVEKDGTLRNAGEY